LAGKRACKRRYNNNRYGTTNNYNLGYRHGCNTSKRSYTKNRYKYRNSSSYRNGWLAGKRACKKRYYNNRTYSKSNYNLGYRHGCRTSEYRYTKNSYKFRNSSSYRRGWRAGRRACRRY
jgi:hypothetical protein